METDNNAPITVRPTDDAIEALKFLLEHYRKEFSGIKRSDIINKAIIELAKQVHASEKK